MDNNSTNINKANNIPLALNYLTQENTTAHAEGNFQRKPWI